MRTALKSFRRQTQLTNETTNKYSVVTVTNRQKYQKDEYSAADASTKALTDEQPTIKRIRMRERALVPNGTFGNVLLTEKCGGANV